MTAEEFSDFIAQANWTFAKTMPENPHWYTHRKWNDNAAVMFIRDSGAKRKFGKATYVYYDLEGYTYWTMGAPLPITIILNRAALAND